MDQTEVELGAIRGQLAFHQARLAHVLLEREGRQADADLEALLARAREQLAEGSLEQSTFDQAALDPWSDLERRLAEA